ncbi:NusG domain II-containing protein [Enterococcus sp.]|uniref:NusG domain II-containing protein n=1 Tax=Enterococcus sp. TaxID=35783 RepID=UPI00289ECE52|nr:NusG domain II-containing protein [Enterococcus sp.]
MTKLKAFIKNAHLKPWDGVIILLLILSSFLPILIFGQTQTATKEAVLRVDGTEIKRFDLVEGQKSYTYLYEDEDGDYNLLEIDGDRIRIKEANCGDQICVRRGWASKNGETIVCLPHKMVIEIQASDGSETDDLIY